MGKPLILLGCRRFLNPVIVSLGCCLPVFPVERADLDRGQIDAIDTAHIKSPPAWIESRPNERVDSAVLAEIVLGRSCIELVKDEIVLAGEDMEVCICRRMPERALATTYGAVAIDNVVELGPNLEGDPPAMARTLIALNHHELAAER
jgi:hypothetical protein